MTATYVPSQLRDLPGLGLSLVSVRDYGAVGSGLVDDLTAIQAAIAAVSALGAGIVWFPRGTYRVSAAVVCASNVVLMGEGPQSVIKLADGANTVVASIPEATSDPVVRFLKLDGNRANQTIDCQVVDARGTRILLDGVEIANAKYHGVYLNGATDVTIERSYIHDTGHCSVYPANVNGLHILDSRLEAWTLDGADDTPAITFDGNGPLYNRRVKILGNEFANTIGTRFAIEAPVRIDYGQISGNTFDGNGLGGNGVSCWMRHSVVGPNVFKDGGGGTRSGLEMGGGDLILTENVIEQGSIYVGAGVVADGERIAIRGNQVTNSIVNGKGLSIGNASNPTTDVDVDGNRILVTGTGSVHGINLGFYGTQGQVNRINIRNNVIRDGSNNAEGIGIHGAAGSSDIFVQGNVVSGCNQGVYIPPDTNHDEVTIANNDLRGNSVAVSNNATGGTIRVGNNILANDQASVES